MKLPIRSIALALGLTVTAIGCTDQQSASPGTPAATTETPSAEAPVAEAPVADAIVDASTLAVVSWGPKTTQPGVAFNAQPDGNSGIFVELSGAVPLTEFQATIGGQPLSGVVASGNVVTATIPADYLQTPGSYPVELVVPEQNARIQVGDFVVEDGQSSAE